jgi:YHS domain-containing protein
MAFRVQMTRFRWLILTLLMSLGFAGALRADQVRVFTQDGVAIGGYDVVIYFTENRAALGDARHAVMWKGATWYFASPETMSSFEMNPKAYAPQYGGFCAYAMSEGRLADPSPTSFTILNGKLYLNDGPGAQSEWSSAAEANIAAANAHWKAILGR